MKKDLSLIVMTGAFTMRVKIFTYKTLYVKILIKLN